MKDPDPSQAQWARACLAAHVLCVDPSGVGGILVTARAGPVRDAWQGLLSDLPLPRVNLHPHVDDDVLFGGLDLSTLGHDQGLVRRRGLLDDPAAILLKMAERCASDMAARVSLCLDANRGHCVVAFEEKSEPTETVPESLRDRLACHITLDGLPLSCATPIHADGLAAARSRLATVKMGDCLRQLTSVAARLGIDSLRAPTLAGRVARASAALAGRPIPNDDDLQAAIILVLAPRARQLPEVSEETQSQEPPPQPQGDDADTPEHTSQAEIPDEMLVDAVRVALPQGILAETATKGGKGQGGSGQVRTGNHRGRPKPSRAGRSDGRSRIDVLATLRAAVPWQRLRPRSPGLAVALRQSDLRFKRYETRSDRLLVFAVDASGSQAMRRLGEAKGAVELLLSKAYASRDHAALVAFRGAGAELLLSPTRSLVQAKRSLGALPGGGGTPLAAGLQIAAEVALQARQRGLSPTLVLLTDGKGNISLTGAKSRADAQDDALEMAGWISRSGLDAVVLDTGLRSQPGLKDIADRMGARLVPLPQRGDLPTRMSQLLSG